MERFDLSCVENQTKKLLTRYKIELFSFLDLCGSLKNEPYKNHEIK